MQLTLPRARSHPLEDVSFIEPKHAQFDNYMPVPDPFLVPLCRLQRGDGTVFREFLESCRAAGHFHAERLSPSARREKRSVIRGTVWNTPDEVVHQTSIFSRMFFRDLFRSLHPDTFLKKSQ